MFSVAFVLFCLFGALLAVGSIIHLVGLPERSFADYVTLILLVILGLIGIIIGLVFRVARAEIDNIEDRGYIIMLFSAVMTATSVVVSVAVALAR